jgi:uracil-DNA glycosylase
MEPAPHRRHPGTGRVHESPVRPGSGWPGDPADGRSGTVIARDAAAVAAAASAAPDPASLDAAVSVCRACPRLVAWREEVAANPRRSFAGEAYWGRPVAGWGPARARIVLLGLAPAAHGGNRTGRIFTGDRSGDWLFAALYRVGLARQPTSTATGDGQDLDVDGPGTRITAAVHCAPPANVPTPVESAACRPWLLADLRLTPDAAVVVALGGIAWAAGLTALVELGCVLPRPRPRFTHGHEVRLSRPGGRPLTLLGCYHPSQQNTFTGVLTADMTDRVLRRAIELGAIAGSAGHLEP